MNGQYQSASIRTAVHNARILCHEIGSEIIYDDPAFEVAMEMAYWLDELLCDLGGKRRLFPIAPRLFPYSSAKAKAITGVRLAL
jgi:hypothetical protein